MAYEDFIQAQIDALNNPQPAQLPVMPRGTPDDGTRPGWLGLLGEALSGGQSPTYRLRGQQEDLAGSRALLNFGINMMLASGPQRVRPDLFSAAASGLQGAAQSMDLSQRQAAAVAQQDFTQRMELAKLGVEQDRDRVEKLKALLPLIQLQQRPVINPDGTVTSGGAKPGGSIFTGDINKDRATIVAQESKGNPKALNYVAEADPTAYDRGATASGKYGFVNSTWREGLQLAGLDPASYATAREAPEDVQDKVFNAVYAKYGSRPWDASTWKSNWQRQPNGTYALVPTGGGGGATPAPYTTASLTPTPPPGTLPVPPIPPAEPPPVPAQPITPAPAATTTPTPTTPTSGPLAGLPKIDDFVAQNMAKPTPDEEASWHTPLSDQEEKGLQDGLKRLQSTVDAARASYNSGAEKGPEAYNAAQKAYEDAQRAIEEKRREALKVGDDRKAKWFEAERQRLKDVYGELVKGNVTMMTADNAANNERKKKVLEGIDADVSLTADRISSLTALRTLSDNIGKGTLIGDMQVAGRPLTDLLSTWGLGGPEWAKKAADIQTFQAAANQAVKDLKSGIAMGSMSDRDLTFIENMVANPKQSPETRSMIITGLIAAQERKRDISVRIGNLIGGGVPPHQAIAQANQEARPLFTQVPKEIDRADADTRAAWFQDNVRPNSIYRTGTGAVRFYYGPEGPPPVTQVR